MLIALIAAAPPKQLVRLRQSDFPEL